MKLEELGIRNYKYDEKGNLFVLQDIHWEGKGFESIPVKIYKVEGDFNLKGNEIKDFHNFPHEVTGVVNLSYNRIDSFETYPQDCIITSLILDKNRIRHFKGSPSKLKTFSVEGNPLESLENIPMAQHLFIHINDLVIRDGINREYYRIYQEACFRESWDNTKSIKENFVKLIRLFPSYIGDAKSFGIYEDCWETIKNTVQGSKFGL
jgi:hypothetical protein